MIKIPSLAHSLVFLLPSGPQLWLLPRQLPLEAFRSVITHALTVNLLS